MGSAASPLFRIKGMNKIEKNTENFFSNYEFEISSAKYYCLNER